MNKTMERKTERTFGGKAIAQIGRKISNMTQQRLLHLLGVSFMDPIQSNWYKSLS